MSPGASAARTTDDPPTPPDGAERRRRRRATWLLIALRTAYAYAWFDIGPGLPGIGATFGVGPDAWGLLVGGFLLGAGLFQVPAGLFARRWGSRSVALAGAAMLAVASLAGAAAPSFGVLFASRLAAGAGAGLFFSPAIGLVGSLFPAGERGVPVGTFSSAFSLGAAVGVFASAAVIPWIGWRGSLALGGALLSVLTALAVAKVPREYGAAPVRTSAARPARVVAYRLRAVWAIGLAFVGYEGATFVAGQFVVPWGESVHGWTAVVAGAVGTSFVLPSVLGGPVGGVVAERTARPRAALAAVTVAGAIVLAALPFLALPALVVVGIVFSFGYGFAYAVMYVLPHRWPELPAEEIPLAIGLFNAVQLGGGAAVALLFGLVVAQSSYAVAWPLLAGVQLATLGILAFVPVVGAGGRPRGAAGAPPVARLP